MVRMHRVCMALLLLGCEASPALKPPPPPPVALMTAPPPEPASQPNEPEEEEHTKINPALPLPERARILAVTGQKVLLQMNAERTYFAVLDTASLCVEESLQEIPSERFGFTSVPLALHLDLEMAEHTPAAMTSDGRVIYATLQGKKECARTHDRATKKTTTLTCARSRGDASFGVSPRGSYYALVDRTQEQNVLTVYRVADKKPVTKLHTGNQYVEPSSYMSLVLDDDGHVAWTYYNDFGNFAGGMVSGKSGTDQENGSSVGFLPDGSVLVLDTPMDPRSDETLAGNACKTFRRASFVPLIETPPTSARRNSTPSP